MSSTGGVSGEFDFDRRRCRWLFDGHASRNRHRNCQVTIRLSNRCMQPGPSRDDTVSRFQFPGFGGLVTLAELIYPNATD